MMRMKRAMFLVGPVLAVVAAAASAAPTVATVTTPYVFTDDKAVIATESRTPTVAYKIRVIDASGWGPTARGVAVVQGGVFRIAPLGEGIHIFEAESPPEWEARFVAMTPPSKVDRKAVLACLPLNGGKLMGGQPYVILSMGDSVTSTGDYETMLVMMLKRATGNPNIRFIDKSKYGMTVDYTVRRFSEIACATEPDAGLLMYGLNDERTFAFDASREGYRFVAENLRWQCHADPVFFQPTPHYAIPVNGAARMQNANPAWYAFRTIGYAESLRPLAAELGVPLAETFLGIWGRGGSSLEESARNAWPLFPKDMRYPTSTLLESNGNGDPVHCNALGQLMIAKAAFAAMTGQKAQAPPLHFTAFSEWTAAGVVSHVAVANVSADARSGVFAVYPMTDGSLTMDRDGDYRLKPGESTAFDVRWPSAVKPADLLKHPLWLYLAPGEPLIPVVDFSGGASRVYAVSSRFDPDVAVMRERVVTMGPDVPLHLRDGKDLQVFSVALPTNSPVGRMPLIREVRRGGRAGWVVAELAWCRYGIAKPGEAVADGDLDEWAGHDWIPVGEPCQARSLKGVEDNRESSGECYVKWAFKADDDSIWIAASGVGHLTNDTFMLWFDPREPRELGTVGRYYWVGGSLASDGAVNLTPGETSPTNGLRILTGRWSPTTNGIAMELRVPYASLERSAWPTSGDLGLQVQWNHVGEGNRKTTLYWADDGQPWTPRWYGVVRRERQGHQSLPYMVRVR